MSRLLPLALSVVLLITVLLNVACGGVSPSTTTTIPTSIITTTNTPPTTTTQSLTITTTTTKKVEDLSSIQVSYIIITPGTATIAAGGSQLYTVTAYDYEGNSFNVTRDCDFFITRGAGGTWVLNEYISENTGTWQVAADYWNPISGTEFWRDEATLIVKE